MKIAICTLSLVEGHGGVASYAHDFAGYFPDADITIITGDDYDARPADNFRVVNFDASLSVDAGRRLISLISDLAPDIVVNSWFPLLTAAAPYLPDSVRIITVSHFVNGELAWYSGHNHRYVDRIVALSSHGRRYFRRTFGPAAEAKTDIVFNPVPPQLPNLPASQLPNSPTSPLTIVYPGGSNYVKSADIVALALRRLLKTDLDFRFYWIGNDYVAGGRHIGLPVRHISECFPADPRIARFGRVERDEARRIMGSAHIFILPSRLEGFPISLCEALAGGAIPIISDAPHGSLDLIENRRNGIVVPQGSPDALFRAIADIIRHPDAYAGIQRQAAATVATDLSPEKWTAAMRRIFTLAPDHAPRRPFTPLRFRLSLLRCRLIHLRRKAVDALRLTYNLALYTLLRAFPQKKTHTR